MYLFGFEKLGHVNHVALTHSLEFNLVPGAPYPNSMIDINGQDECITCIRSKLQRHYSRKPAQRMSRPFELLHSDSCGPMPASKAGSRFFILFIDDFTRMTYVYFLQRKNAELYSNTFVEFLNYQRSHYPQFLVAQFRSDDGRGVYDNELFKRLLRERGISFEPCVPYSLHQNGVAERMIQTITTRVRSILLDAGLPIDLWAEIVNTAVYLQQWIPSTSLANNPLYILLEYAFQIGDSTTNVTKTPESTYSIDLLRRIGCVAYWRTPDATRDSKTSLKFGARALLAMML